MATFVQELYPVDAINMSETHARLVFCLHQVRHPNGKYRHTLTMSSSPIDSLAFYSG